MAESKQKRVEPQDVLVSVATLPLLAGLVASRAIAEVVLSLSQASEELLRGDRLPVLHLSQPPQSSHDSPSE